jgi:hypothetical protein
MYWLLGTISQALLRPTLRWLHLESPLISQIVDKAFFLAMNISLQRSRLQITFPNIGEMANTPDIASLPTLSESDVDNRIVAPIVTPCLTKWGDVHVRGFDHRYNIVPALRDWRMYFQPLQRFGIEIETCSSIAQICSPHLYNCRK